MAISITDYLNIDKEVFEQIGAFDAILNVDTKLFIDPHLLKGCKIPEFINSYNTVNKRFRDILLILKHSKKEGDVFWNKAEKYFKFPEVKGLCIGYSNKSTSGSAIGPVLRKALLNTAKSIIDVGVEEPEIFELVGLIEKNIGPDRISDMVANIIYMDIIKFSERIFETFEIETKNIKFRGTIYKMVVNPYNKAPILLLPKEILRDLPIAYGWDDLDYVCSQNEDLRRKVNSIIGDTWKQAVSQKKKYLKDLIIEEPELLVDLISLYRNKPFELYDFISDPSGQVAWYKASKEYTIKHPLELASNELKAPEQMVDFILTICNKYKDLIENNALYSLLYENNSKPKKEEAAQKLFFGIADAYCEANNIDVSREVNGGRGPVDFKFSKGYDVRVVVESKLTTNNQLLHGFTTQILEYQKAEKTKYGVYLIIDLGGPRKRLNDLQSLKATYLKERLRMPEIVYIDARPKESASKYKEEHHGN